MVCCLFFFFKQKTAYELRISDWSSDVCSSDLLGRFWAHPILAALAILCGLRHEVRGREHLPEGAVLIAAKHQSAWDTIIFSILLWDHSFVLKRELMWTPLFGLYLARAGLIAVDRRGGARALKRMVAAARKAARLGRPIVIFPEGTRVAPDQQDRKSTRLNSSH